MRPASTIRSLSDLSCWILWGVLPMPRTPTRMTCSSLPRLVRLLLAPARPAVVGPVGDGMAGDPPRRADGRRLGHHFELLRDALAGAVAEGDQALAAPRPVEPERHRDPHGGRAQVPDLAHEARLGELLLGRAGAREGAQRLGVRLARADGRVRADVALGDVRQRPQRRASRYRVRVAKHPEPVARPRPPAQAADVVSPPPGARR